MRRLFFFLSHLSVLYREDSSGTMNRTPGRRRRTMRLRDTGLTAEELKEMVNKYMVETYERYDFIAERAEGMYLYDEKGKP